MVRCYICGKYFNNLSELDNHSCNEYKEEIKEVEK